MLRYCYRLLPLLLLLLLTACRPIEQPTHAEPLRHARLLRLTDAEGYALAEVRNPWDTTQVMARYILVPREEEVPAGLPEGTVVRTPLARSLTATSLHAALALRLGVGERVCGICDADYVVSKAVKAAGFTDYGSSMQLPVERILTDSLDAVLHAPYEGQSPPAALVGRVAMVACADYMEATPLGMAEWMRFYGRLWGVGARADSLFAQEEKAYERLREQVEARGGHRPRLMVDRPVSGTWYVPGGDSYLARLFADAGADYVHAHHRGAGGLPLSLETILADARDAELWVIKYAAPATLTTASLTAEHPLFSQLPPLRQRRVWSCNTLRQPYYEELPFAPSRLLREWVAMLWPAAGHRPALFSRLP